MEESFTVGENNGRLPEPRIFDFKFKMNLSGMPIRLMAELSKDKYDPAILSL